MKKMYKVIPRDKLRRMYKRRFKVLRWFKELFPDQEESDQGPWMTFAMWLGPGVIYVGGMWLAIMAIADMAMRLIM